MERSANPVRLVAMLALLAATVGCGEAPLEPQTPEVMPDLAVAARPGEPISGYITITDVLSRPNEFTTPGGTTHYRGTTFEVTFVGDFDAVVIWEQVSNWNKSFNGVLSAQIDGEGSWGGLTGGVSGRAAVYTHEAEFGGTYVLHGDGELAGHKIRVSGEGPLGCPTPCPYTGVVVVPASAR